MCVYTQLCLTLCDPMDCSPPGSSVCGISQARILGRLPFPSPGDLLEPGSNPCLLHLLGWQVDLLPQHHLGSPCIVNPKHILMMTFMKPNLAPGCHSQFTIVCFKFFRETKRYSLRDIQTTCLRQFPVSMLECVRFILMMSCLCKTEDPIIAMSKYHMKVNAECGTGTEASNA